MEAKVLAAQVAMIKNSFICEFVRVNRESGPGRTDLTSIEGRYLTGLRPIK